MLDIKSIALIFLLSVCVRRQSCGVSTEGPNNACTGKKLEIGIAFDGSRSISSSDFKAGIAFLRNFLSQFQIGPNKVRVSFLQFGSDVRDVYNLSSFNNYTMLNITLGSISQVFSIYTHTHLAINYLNMHQLNNRTARSGVGKVAIVITDGDSHFPMKTKDEAYNASANGINMVAIGIGQVKESELLNIAAGCPERVFKVNNYTPLLAIIESVAGNVCVTCGVNNPANIYFVFSPSDLGDNATAWATSFISATIENKRLAVGFKFAVISGSCPDDAGFNFNTYNNTEDIKNRLRSWNSFRLPSNIRRVSFSPEAGARPKAANVTVLITKNSSREAELRTEINNLVAAHVQVYVVYPSDGGKAWQNTTALTGSNYTYSSDQLVSYVCQPYY